MIVLDYGKKVVKIGGDEVTFEPLPSAFVAFLRSVVELPVGSPVRVQAGLLGNHFGLALSGKRQLVKTDERVLVAPVITKVNGNNSVWLELVNTTRSPVILQPGTKVQHLQPIIVGVNTVNDFQSEEVREATEVPIDELKIGHLSEEQQSALLNVLKKHHVWPSPGTLGKTHLVERPVDVQGTQPIRLRPYRVPETKRQVIAQEVQKMLLSNVIQPSSSPWSSPVALLQKPNGEHRFCVD